MRTILPIHHTHHRRAFSMLELIFVIVILGIVSSVGATVIAQIYDGYITQRATHKASKKTELVATQLVNRLSYAIPGTVIGRFNNANFVDIINIPVNNPPTILEWIGYDNDGFSANIQPYWSGYVDTDASAINQLNTPGSQLNNLNTVITNLSASTLANAAVVFPDELLAHHVGFAENPAGDTNNIHPLANPANNGNTQLILVARANRTIKEHYKLAWSAYAVVPIALTAGQIAQRGLPAGAAVFDLQLFYDYQPWLGEAYWDNGVANQIIARNVSVFRFTGAGSTVRFKICQREVIGQNFTINNCKEKAVIR